LPLPIPLPIRDHPREPGLHSLRSPRGRAPRGRLPNPVAGVAGARLALALPLLACATAPSPAPPAPAAVPTSSFSGERAARDLEALAATPSDAEARAHVREALEAAGLPVELLTLEARGPEGPFTLEHLMVDVPDAEESHGRLLLVAPLGRGAGSRDASGADLAGAAFALEMARALAEDPLPIDVSVAFLDGELGAAQGWLGARSLAQAIASDPQALGELRLVVYAGALGPDGRPLARDRRSHRSSRDAFFRAARAHGAEALFPANAVFSAPDAGHLAFRGVGVRRVVLLHTEPAPAAPEEASDAEEPVAGEGLPEEAATQADAASTASPAPAPPSAARLAAVGEVVEATLRAQARWWQRVDRMAGVDAPAAEAPEAGAADADGAKTAPAPDTDASAEAGAAPPPQAAPAPATADGAAASSVPATADGASPADPFAPERPEEGGS